MLFNCRVPVELIGSRAFGSLIILYEAMRHGIYEIPPSPPPPFVLCFSAAVLYQLTFEDLLYREIVVNLKIKV